MLTIIYLLTAGFNLFISAKANGSVTVSDVIAALLVPFVYLGKLASVGAEKALKEGSNTVIWKKK